MLEETAFTSEYRPVVKDNFVQLTKMANLMVILCAYAILLKKKRKKRKERLTKELRK